MKGTHLSKTDTCTRQLAGMAKIASIRYSKSDYFCESQQSQSTKEDNNDRKTDTEFNSNEQDRFFGHYNKFF
jgi:hypothetical protein